MVSRLTNPEFFVVILHFVWGTVENIDETGICPATPVVVGGGDGDGDGGHSGHVVNTQGSSQTSHHSKLCQSQNVFIYQMSGVTQGHAGS